MADLITFLRARLDDDAEFASEAIQRRWVTTDNYVEDVNGGDVARFEIEADARHAGAWDPVRVLAEVEAKRRILDLHSPGTDPCDAHDAHLESIPCEVVELLALPYADHPDYQETWRV